MAIQKNFRRQCCELKLARIMAAIPLVGSDLVFIIHGPGLTFVLEESLDAYKWSVKLIN